MINKLYVEILCLKKKEEKKETMYYEMDAIEPAVEHAVMYIHIHVPLPLPRPWLSH